MTTSFVVLAVLTTLSTIPGLYFASLELRSPTKQVRQVGWCVMVRNVALAVVTLVVVVLGSHAGLAAALAWLLYERKETANGALRTALPSWTDALGARSSASRRPSTVKKQVSLSAQSLT